MNRSSSTKRSKIQNMRLTNHPKETLRILKEDILPRLFSNSQTNFFQRKKYCFLRAQA